MTRSKVFKKAFSLIASSAMTFAMALPVFAEGEDTKQTEAWISKTYNTEVSKAETFSFTATQNTENEELIHTAADITIDSISFDGNNPAGTETKRSKITFPNYTEAGQYEYTVTESQTANPAVTGNDHEKLIMSKAEYTVDVYVVNDETGDDCSIANIIVNKSKDDAGNVTNKAKVDISDSDSNGFKFTNTYVQEAGTGDNPGNPDPSYNENGSFKISKTIKSKGETVDDDKEFDFTATFVFPAGTDANTLGGVKGDGTAITLDNGSYSFKLKRDGKMKFTGLPVGTTVSLTEAATPNYKGSFTITLDDTVVQGSPFAAQKYGDSLTTNNLGKLGKAKNTADVTNTYNYVPATGIIMNSLPYITMIGIGVVALGFYIASKHRKISD